MRPPLGAGLLAFMALVAGFAEFLIGLRLVGVVTFGPADLGSGLLVSGAFALAVGVAWFAAAYAMWTTQAWAWLLGMILAVLGVLSAVVVLFETGDLAQGLAAALLPLIVLWYLQQGHIKKTFHVDID